MRPRLGVGTRPIVLLPTYQERDNLPLVLEAIFETQPAFHVLVIDDASPDGTGKCADAIAARDARVKVLHRPSKEGLGRAYLDGFRWALHAHESYTHIFEMDADLSHPPRYLQALLQSCLDGADLAVGSRYVEGGGTQGWPWPRRWISRGASLYTRTLLGLHLHDWTAGFVCFPRATLEKLDLDNIRTHGYGFQIEIKLRCAQLGLQIVERPIIFVDRERGRSKMTPSIFIEAMSLVWQLRGSGRSA